MLNQRNETPRKSQVRYKSCTLARFAVLCDNFAIVVDKNTILDMRHSREPSGSIKAVKITIGLMEITCTFLQMLQLTFLEELASPVAAAPPSLYVAIIL